MGKHNEFGRLGEDVAANYLIDNGYTISCRNYRYLKAEIDIIARKDDILAVVEVKSRSDVFLQEISETISKKKISLLMAAADHYVQLHDLDVEVRFDTVFIVKKGKDFQLEHLKDAFYHF